jgi:hypothetical protein
MTRRQRRTRALLRYVSGVPTAISGYAGSMGAAASYRKRAQHRGPATGKLTAPGDCPRGLLTTVTYAPGVALVWVVVGACPASSWASRSALSEAS